MNQSLKFSDAEFKTKEALAVWVNWMQQGDEKRLGYGKCAGFSQVSAVSGWDDFERKVESNLAINVQAIYEGLKISQRLAIDHFHLAAVWLSNRTNIEDDYADALISMQIVLRRRGLI
jgi:hypothetical protein